MKIGPLHGIKKHTSDAVKTFRDIYIGLAKKIFTKYLEEAARKILIEVSKKLGSY